MTLPTAPEDASARAKGVGTRIPNFQLRDRRGGVHQLQGFLGEGACVLVFVRGAWCPYCDAQLASLAEHEADFRERGLPLIVVTPDATAFAGEQEDTRFATVLVDPELLVAELLGLTYRVDADLRRALIGDLGVVLPDRTGVARWELPVPSTFVLDGDGRVTASWSSADPSVRPSIDEILAAASSSAR